MYRLNYRLFYKPTNSEKNRLFICFFTLFWLFESNKSLFPFEIKKKPLTNRHLMRWHSQANHDPSTADNANVMFDFIYIAVYDQFIHSPLSPQSILLAWLAREFNVAVIAATRFFSSAFYAKQWKPSLINAFQFRFSFIELCSLSSCQ